jgi:LysM repeat protein
MNNGLNIGQTVKIPLNITNFSQSTQVGAPVYYIVGEKEGLYRISTKNNKVLMENLRKWNNLKSDAVAAGQKLVVGYLVSVPSSGSVASTTNEPKAPQPQQKATAVGERKTDANPQAAVTASRTSPSTTASRGAQANAGSGYFKGQYDSQTKKTAAAKDQTATAGIFKTASGWQDGKYYALIDNVEPGTIIRVVNPSNNKAVFAKVLGEMSGIRQNEGLEVRISNAAASALDIAEQDKFIVRINY